MILKTNEQWKTIKDFPDYQVSNFGNVKSFITYKDGKLLKPSDNGRGYLQVVLTNGKRKTIRVHRLVAMAFIPNPSNKTEVNHIDLNKKNNSASNLEWTTRSENMQHNKKNGVGSSIPIIATNIKTGETQIFYSIVEGARFLKLSDSHIGQHLKGSTRYSHIGGYTFKRRYNDE